MTKKSENLLKRYVDEATSTMELNSVERAEFEEEMYENIKSSVEELIIEGYEEDQAVKTAIDRFGNDSFETFETYGKEKKHREDVEDMPARLFSLVMGLIIAVVAISIFVPTPVKYLAILAVISGVGYSIISLLTKKK